MARGRVGKTPRGSNFGNSCTKIQVFYLFIRESDELNTKCKTHLPLIQEGFLSVQVKECAKSTVLYPYSTQGPNPTNRQIFGFMGLNVLSSRRS